jgi:hypothetical protein
VASLKLMQNRIISHAELESDPNSHHKIPITMGLNRLSKRSFFVKVIKNVQDIGRSTQFLKFSVAEVLAYHMRGEVPWISIPFVGEATQGV